MNIKSVAFVGSYWLIKGILVAMNANTVIQYSAADQMPPQIDTPYDHAMAGLAPVLVQYWAAVVRWRWVIISIIAASMIVGLVVSLLSPRQFTADAQLEISREQKRIVKVDGIDSQQSGQDQEFYATQHALLKARSVAERVSKSLGLTKDDRLLGAHGASDSFAGTGAEVDPAKRQKQIVDLLLENVAVVPLRQSRLVNLTYTSRSPDLSAKIANSWTQAFIATSMDRQFASTAEARKLLEVRLEALRQKLENSERQVVSYAAENDIVTLARNVGPDGKTSAERTLVAADLEVLNEELARATADRIQAQARMRARSDKQKSDDPLSGSATAFLRQKRAEVAAEYASLMVIYEPEYPAAAALAAELRVLDSSIAGEEARLETRDSRRYSSIRNSDFEAAVNRERNLRRRVDSIKSRLATQQRSTIQYTVYQRDADTNRQLYDALLQRYKEIGISGTIAPNNIAVVQTAEVPTVPSAPNIPLNLAAALLLGCVVAGVFVVGSEMIDEGIREPGQVFPTLGLPLLGHTPFIETSVTDDLLDSKSHTYEAYFSVRSNLAFSTNHGFPASLAITSTRAAEGKSSTSMALAMVLARTGKKVLLIDADMRSPSLHRLMSSTNESGLCNILAGDEEWQALVKVTRYQGLSLLAAGPTPPNAAELLSGDRLAALIASCQTHYDHVILDAPPVLGLADAPILARAVEGCVFVVEAEGMPKRGVRAAISRLQMAQAHIFGVVLTKLRQHNHGYGYGSNSESA